MRKNTFYLAAICAFSFSCISMYKDGSNSSGHSLNAEDGTALNTVYPESNKATLSAGEALYHNQYLKSGDGRFILLMQPDGNLVLYNVDKGAIWASNTAGQPVRACIMQEDGNLVLYDGAGKPYWYSNTHVYPEGRLHLQNDGNLVIYQNNAARWASNTCINTARN